MIPNERPEGTAWVAGMVWTIAMMFLGLWLVGVVGRGHAGLWEHLFLLASLASGALATALSAGSG